MVLSFDLDNNGFLWNNPREREKKNVILSKYSPECIKNSNVNPNGLIKQLKIWQIITPKPFDRLTP